MKRITKASMAIMVASSLMLAGCGGGSADKPGKADGKGTPDAGQSAEAPMTKASDFLKASYDELKDGGTLTYGIGEVTDQMLPFHADASADTTTIWYWYNPQIALYDDQGEWYPNPAFITDWKEEVKDNKTVITFTIHKDAKWNDGEPITWKAFEATWKANNGEDQENFPSGNTGGYKDIESVVAGDNDKVAVVTFKGVFPWWRQTFEGLLNPKALDPKIFKEGYIKNPHPEWGAGPYKLDSVDFQAGNVTFVPNEKYWAEKGKLSKVVLRGISDDAEINAFLNGEIDALGIGNADRLAKVKDMQNISRYTAASRSLALLQINADAPLMGDEKVRKAIFHALDRKTLLEIRFQGMNYTEPPLGSLLLKPTQKGYQDNMGELGAFDLEKAKALLDEAGWKMESGKEFRSKDGKELAVKIPSFSTSNTAKALFGAIQAMMKAAGINMIIDQRKPADFSKTMANKDFDITYMGFQASNPFGMGDLGQIYLKDSELSKTGLGSEELDKVIHEAEKAPNAEKAIEEGNKAEHQALQQAGWMPLYVGPTMVATKEGLANMGAMGFTIVPKEHIGWKK